MKSLLVIVEPDEKRREEFALAFGQEPFTVLAVGPEAATSFLMVSPDAVALSFLGGRELLEMATGWGDDPERARIPLVAIVPAEDRVLAEEAWAAGMDEVFLWPAQARELATRLRGLRRMVQLKREVSAFERTLNAIVKAFEGREPHTIDHGERVARTAVAMGNALGLSSETCERMRRGALLHDIGTLVLTDQVLSMPAPLTQAAMEEVRSHPVVGYELLRGIPSLEPILQFVHRHHERVDGSGFPDGLSGSEIPLPIQVVSLADAYDSITSSRPYRPVYSHEKAMGILLDEARRGIWDPALLDLLARALGPGGQGISLEPS
jgi:putative two-component system response regulator